jgi:phosphonate transport system permease protein
VLGLVLAAGIGAALWLGLFTERLGPDARGLDVASRFFSRALSPALESEDPTLTGNRSLLPNLGEGLLRTVTFAAASLGLSLVLGLLLGFLGSTAWWRGDPAGGSRALRWIRRTVAPVLYGVTRAAIALLRSVHEVIWAIVLLAAFGRSDLSAVVALAIPYSGTLAKVFSEMIDEAPRGAALALRSAGASPAQVFAVGLLPRALPDMTAYAVYQFECALRSSAVLGFFGYRTFGYFIQASFANQHWGEVWTYLYALIVLVVAAEWWSGALRRRLVS